MSAPKELLGRKLLVASVGLATVSYVGCGVIGGDGGSSGNLLPPPIDAAAEQKPIEPPPPSGNLVPPPPPPDTLPADTGTGDVGDASDGGARDAADGSADVKDAAPDVNMQVGNGNVGR
jgi:hypothetical protein